jgi:hypothetical protein
MKSEASRPIKSTVKTTSRALKVTRTAVQLRLLASLIFSLLVWGARTAASERADEPSGGYYDWKKTLQPERPYLHPYYQTLVMKIFLAIKQTGNQSKVYLTLEQALDVIRRLDNLTLGIPRSFTWWAGNTMGTTLSTRTGRS